MLAFDALEVEDGARGDACGDAYGDAHCGNFIDLSDWLKRMTNRSRYLEGRFTHLPTQSPAHPPTWSCVSIYRIVPQIGHGVEPAATATARGARSGVTGHPGGGHMGKTLAVSE